MHTKSIPGVDIETVKRLKPLKFISPSSSDEILADDKEGVMEEELDQEFQKIESRLGNSQM
jgi:hypothetical protein